MLRRISLVERRLVEVEVGGERFYHLDKIVDMEHLTAWESEDAEKMNDVSTSVDGIELLWSDDPLTRTPPEPDAEVDRPADAIELQRLQAMGVLKVLETKDYGLDLLTTRMIYDLHIKDWKNPQTGEVKRRWMRRARLVAREYANQRRDDAHSPASGSQVLRLLPAMYLMMLGVEGVPRDQLQIGGLDVKDAFLMASQEQPIQITTKGGRFKVLKNLPGQRLAAKAWYEFVAAFLEKRGVDFCKENPCLGRRNESLFILPHVVDRMFCGLKDEVERLINELNTEFTMPSTWPSFLVTSLTSSSGPMRSARMGSMSCLAGMQRR